MLAMSLPIDTVLVVKEHPWMLGKRDVSAYKKMMNIPRVRFADPALEARKIIMNARLVAVITGSVALEAAVLEKPVITFGDCPYNILPQSMVRRCVDLRNLQLIIRQAIQEYEYNESALLAYVCAVLDTSVGINLYSVLLGKSSVHVDRPSNYSSEIEKLSEYVVELIENHQKITTDHHAAARW
jgi:CDP-glycerol glycerophosphotransferase (TagB/SpsB family)